jgi:hypothetical protein
MNGHASSIKRNVLMSTLCKWEGFYTHVKKHLQKICKCMGEDTLPH